ncbi:MAG: hypothetical protein IPH13_08920 [Planctomycetes bacterium]|nr:hypothetical protein [Planctomycetota bacterium]MCC7172274.1 hypothetical protein [Planctomycetota bacterium]
MTECRFDHRPGYKELLFAAILGVGASIATTFVSLTWQDEQDRISNLRLAYAEYVTSVANFVYVAGDYDLALRESIEIKKEGKEKELTRLYEAMVGPYEKKLEGVALAVIASQHKLLLMETDAAHLDKIKQTNDLFVVLRSACQFSRSQRDPALKIAPSGETSESFNAFRENLTALSLGTEALLSRFGSESGPVK